MTSQIPEEAIKAAADVLLVQYGNLGDTAMVRSAVRAILEAGRPHLLAAEVHERVKEQDAIRADLGLLLEALGLGDYARPQSPHEVMLQCIAEAGRLCRAQADTRTDERERIARLAEAKNARFVDAPPCSCGRSGCLGYIRDPDASFADLIREQS